MQDIGSASKETLPLVSTWIVDVTACVADPTSQGSYDRPRSHRPYVTILAKMEIGCIEIEGSMQICPDHTSVSVPRCQFIGYHP